MKKIFSILVSILCFVLVLSAQNIPQGINFQAVARDVEGEILANRNISLKLSLKSQQPSEQIFYVETHQVTTNAFGLFDLIIGQGDPMEGSFERVPWNTRHIMMETAMDDSGGSEYQVLATTNLLAVPYAFHAQTASGFAEDTPEEESLEKSDRPVPCATKTCYCEGGYTEMKLFYFGEDNVTVEVFSDFAMNNLFLTFNNVVSGDLLVIDGSSLPNGRLASNTYFKVITASGEDCMTKIHSRCPTNSWPYAKADQEVLGKTFGNFSVYSHTSQEDNNECTIDDIETDWHVGGNIVGTDNKNLGTRNNEDVIFITNDIARGIINKDGQFGVKTLEPREGVDMDVKGIFIADSIIIRGGLDVGGNLKVHGDSVIIDHNLFVGDTTFTRGLYVKDNVPDGGHLAIFENTHGANGDGIKIKINTNQANNGNDFVSFWDNSGMRGRIEGQTAGELALDPEWIANTAILSAEIVMATAELGMATADVVAAAASTTACIGLGACETIPIPSLITASVANELVAVGNEATAIANLAIYEAFAFDNLGVTYESGAGDYAEWLERSNPAEKMIPGDIVGVFGGKISKKTQGADNFMVVSFNPIVLGNMPKPDRQPLYEKVGFMGQVPVKVKGQVQMGDYILPSGQNDGFGIGVNPENMKADDYGRIVGVAWSNNPKNTAGVIKMAIGINKNDVARKVVQQQKEIQELKDQLKTAEMNFETLASKMEGLTDRLEALEMGTSVSDNIMRTATAEELHSYPITREQIESSFGLLRNNLIDQGIDLENNPAYGKIFSDQEYREQLINQILARFEKERSLMIDIDKKEGF
jgi:uncharacterized coiled-coil protein SlyX